jgi:CrcB protein
MFPSTSVIAASPKPCGSPFRKTEFIPFFAHFAALQTMTRYLLIFMASGLGGILRFWLGGRIQEWSGPTFPWGTLIVNVSGCLGIGFVSSAFSSAWPIREEYQLAVMIGLFGGYTTFSSFGRESLALIDEGHWTRAAIYIVATNVLGLLAVWIGAGLGGKLPAGSPSP